MERSNQTFSREYLQTERARYLKSVRDELIRNHIGQHTGLILGAARDGRIQQTVSIVELELRVHHSQYTLTIDDLLEGYRAKFPDCKVEYGETWEASPKNPNQMNKKSGIVIDWS